MMGFEGQLGALDVWLNETYTQEHSQIISMDERTADLLLARSMVSCSACFIDVKRPRKKI